MEGRGHATGRRGAGMLQVWRGMGMLPVGGVQACCRYGGARACCRSVRGGWSCYRYEGRGHAAGTKGADMFGYRSAYLAWVQAGMLGFGFRPAYLALAAGWCPA